MELITTNQWIIIFALTTSITSCFRILLPALQGVFDRELKNFWNDGWRLFILTIVWLLITTLLITTLLFPIFFLALVVPGISPTVVNGLTEGLANENSKI